MVGRERASAIVAALGLVSMVKVAVLALVILVTTPIVPLKLPWLACKLLIHPVSHSTLPNRSHRRKRGVALAGIELSMQLVNVVFFLVPNAYILAQECAWFGSVVLWSGLVR